MEAAPHIADLHPLSDESDQRSDVVNDDGDDDARDRGGDVRDHHR